MVSIDILISLVEFQSFSVKQMNKSSRMAVYIESVHLHDRMAKGAMKPVPVGF